MDDPELEQFVLEKSSHLSSQLITRHHSSGNSCPADKMNAASPQTPVSYPHILSSQLSTGPFSSVAASLTPSAAIPCSPVETLPSISHFSYPHHEISNHGEAVSSLENQISESNLLELNGNQERYSSVHQIAYHEQEYEGHYQGEFYTNYFSDGVNVSYSTQSSSPECMSDYSYFTGGFPAHSGFDSEDSFEVVFNDQEIQNSIQTQIGHAFRNTQNKSASEERCSLPNFAVFTECKKVPNRRGRPVTYNKPGYHYSDSDSIHSDEDERSAQSKGCRRGAKNILLWKFLLGELRKPHSNHIKWENEREGVFKFVDTAECSRLWGQMKKKEDMNFEKLSRGIRHYYKDGLMSRRDGIRLVYKFNWDRVPRAFWPRIR